MGRKARAYQADVADYAAADQMVDAVIADFGQVDILVNNAGIGSSGIGRPTITESTQEQVDLLMGANLLGPINLCRRLVAHMRPADPRDIVLLPSVPAQNNGPRMGLHTMTQAGGGAARATAEKGKAGTG